MKKILLIILMLSFVGVGCSNIGNISQQKTETQKEKVETPYYISLLKEFQTNPSLNGFYSLCDEGKNLITHITKKTLSKDKTIMEDTHITLFEAIPSCEKINDDDFIFVTDSDTGLFAQLNDSDTDEIRIKKLEFNERIKNDIKNNKVYGYNKISAKDITPFLENTATYKQTHKYGGYWDFEPGISQQNIFLPLNEVHTVICDSYRNITGDRGCFEFE